MKNRLRKRRGFSVWAIAKWFYLTDLPVGSCLMELFYRAVSYETVASLSTRTVASLLTMDSSIKLSPMQLYTVRWNCLLLLLFTILYSIVVGELLKFELFNTCVLGMIMICSACLNSCFDLRYRLECYSTMYTQTSSTF